MSQPVQGHTLATVEAIVALLPRPVFVVDMLMRIVLWNPAAEALLGWSRVDACGQLLSLMMPEAQRLLSHIAGSSISGVTTAVRRQDGSVVEVRLWTSLLTFQGSAVPHALGLLTDITEQSTIPEELVPAKYSSASYGGRNQRSRAQFGP